MANYALLTVESSNPIKRWSHKARFGMAVDIIAPAAGETILDFGTGDGLLPVHLIAAEPEAKIVGYEPFLFAEAVATTEGHAIEVVSKVDDLAGRTFDKVVCMEVLEHLPERELEDALAAMRRLLNPGGTLIFAVPIETGASSLVKNAVRIGMNKRHPGTSLKTVFWSAVGATEKIKREAKGGYITSHLGFDWTRLRTWLTRQNLTIERTCFSPINALGPAMNSQVFMVCRDAAQTTN